MTKEEFHRETMARIRRDLQRLAHPPKPDPSRPLIMGPAGRPTPLVVMRAQAEVLLTELDALDAEREAQRWIPVSERTPDVGEMVLGFFGGQHDIVARGVGNWYDAHGDEVRVAHWRPLRPGPEAALEPTKEPK